MPSACWTNRRAGAWPRSSAERWRRGTPLGPLDGVPVAIKDTSHVAGWPTRIGSHATAAVPSTEDTPGVARLREAGAVFFCKTTTPEFGWKGITHGPLTGITRNPWDTSRTPGGSSGGSAALVAAGVVPLATGGDGGGSLRIPAAFSGVFGLKPSYGVVPNFLGPIGTLAVHGGLSRDVADSALLLNVLTRPDARDSFAIPYRGIDYLDGLDGGVAGMRIAWSPDLGFPVTDPAVVAGMQPAIDALVKAGANVQKRCARSVRCAAGAGSDLGRFACRAGARFRRRAKGGAGSRPAAAGHIGAKYFRERIAGGLCRYARAEPERCTRFIAITICC